MTAPELTRVVARTLAGKIDADLGAYLVKRRISQGAGGRSGGHRAIIVYKVADRIVFVHLFGKRDKATLSSGELRAYRAAARHIADLGPEAIDALLRAEEWIEVDYGAAEDVSE
ncbi:type II toxin-antitoxin system RelE/ParE family toxin [Jiella sp. M17.18]|uniref:type II toxin-antitoxin system RelE/ParE family toxin n=1 Tax=Jiella sp. M17.18 TaxID=3234247 RepID=UPI0034DFBB33